MSTTRREFLEQSAALSALLLGAVRRAAAIPPAPGSTFADARHVVILMQENRSFDHMYGALRGVRGFNDPRAISLPDGNPVWRQTDAAGNTYGPFRLNLRGSKATWLGSLPHSWSDQTDARNGGNHDRWLIAKASGRKECAGMPLTMGYYDRRDLPFYYALADAFTVCDQHFCSSLTGTTPNRLYLWTGKCRSDEGAANIRNSDVTYSANARWTTYPERLSSAGVSWRVYQNELSIKTGLSKEQERWLANFTNNPLEWFEQYHVDHHPAHRKFMGLPDPPALSPAQLALHQGAFTTNEGDPHYRELARLPKGMEAPKGDLLFRFRKDVESGQLPRVSWVIAPEKFSDHPSAPWYGSWYAAEVMNILTANPEVWSKTIFLLTYDENDGYFDHVPPFVSPDPARPESGKVSAGLNAATDYWPLEEDRKRAKPGDARGGPIGLGYRVPLVVASPWSRGGFVCSQTLDHTSVVQLLEKLTGVAEPNISAWRRAVCGDLTAAFRPDPGGAETKLPYPERDDFLNGIYEARNAPMPSGWEQGVHPRQEPGTRPSNGLPYELEAAAVVRDGALRLTLEARTQRFGRQSAGSGFHAYTPGSYRGESGSRVRAYAVKAGERLEDSWALEGFAGGKYDVHVCGPNGFLRAFQGSGSDPAVQISSAYSGDDLELRIRNEEAKPVRLLVRDLSYKAKPRTISVKPSEEAALRISLRKSHQWYDLEVTLEGVEGYGRRLAGRVETGKAGISDPAMA